jgi:hypothetical protein
MNITNIEINTEEILYLLKDNFTKIKENYYSSAMSWGLDYNSFPKEIFYISVIENNERIQQLILNTNDTFLEDDTEVEAGLVLASKIDDTKWTLLELSKVESCHTCDNCDKRIVIGDYRCTICSDYDLCIECNNLIGHEHKLENKYNGSLGFNTYDSYNVKYHVKSKDLNPWNFKLRYNSTGNNL